MQNLSATARFFLNHGIVCYLIIVNIVSFFLFGIDKHRAVRNRWRISEAVLMVFSAVGGAAGSLLGMLLFHHKTRHPKFYLGIPVILTLELILCYFIFVA